MSLLERASFSVIDQTGPLFIGTILNYLLTGILIHQLYDYNKNYPNDSWGMKWLVYGVCTLDMLQTGFTTQFSWYFCVQNWGNIEAFLGSGFAWTASILPIMAGLVAMIVQYFYAWRIWCLGGLWLKICAILITMVAFMEGLCAVIGSIKYDLIGISLIPPATVPYFVVWLSGSFTCDLLIAGCMTLIFMNVRTRSSFDSTNSIISVLIRHVVETAAVTAFCAGVELVLFVTTRNTSLAHTAPAFVLGKLYTNCLLANLNNRKYLTSNSNSEASDNMNVMNSFHLRKLRQKSNRNSSAAVVDLTAIRMEEAHHVQRDAESTMTSRDADNKGIENEASYAKDYANGAAFTYKTGISSLAEP